MRLLNTATLELELFSGVSVPEYAILSHTWGQHELTFQDLGLLSRDVLARHLGYEKVLKSAQVARSMGYAYIWNDTCCIDKTSSAELSEAINSMFRYYAESARCIAYLEDVEAGDDGEFINRFAGSYWFTRGWTLQELIAPREIYFYGKEWTSIGTNATLSKTIYDVTGIPDKLLLPPETSSPSIQQILKRLSVAEKMNWASRRTTTRGEDVAYCLLGIFDINMPLLYGEGPMKAFKRLQEEIIKATDDESIYAWRKPKESLQDRQFWGLLAESPAEFMVDHSIDYDLDGLIPRRPRYLSLRSGVPAAMTNRALQVELPLTPLPTDESGTIFLGCLNCEMERVQTAITPAILLQRTSWDNETHFVRIRPDVVVLIMMNHIIAPEELVDMTRYKTEYLDEAVPRQIFVPHDSPEVGYLKGIIFRPELRHGGGKGDAPYAVLVRSRSPTWQHFADWSVQQPGVTAERYEINFDIIPGPSVDDLEAPTQLGMFELDISFSGSQTLGRLQQPSSAHICLMAGMEPLPPNPLGTPALYFRPWYSFAEKALVEAGDFGMVGDKARRWTQVQLRHPIRASFGTLSSYSALFYHLSLETFRPVDQENTTDSGSWFGSRT